MSHYFYHHHLPRFHTFATVYFCYQRPLHPWHSYSRQTVPLLLGYHLHNHRLYPKMLCLQQKCSCQMWYLGHFDKSQDIYQ